MTRVVTTCMKGAAPFVLLAIGAALLVSCTQGEQPQAAGASATPDPATGYRGSVIGEPLAKPSTLLTDTSGAPFDFARDTAGTLTLVYFGYTNCPDVCPDHFNNIAAAKKSLPPEIADRIKVILVTIDPANDTPERLRGWLDNFDSSFIGLRGSAEEVDTAMREALGSYYVPVVQEYIAAGYTSSTHANFVIAYTDDNLAHIVYPFGTPRETWEHDLPLLVEGWSESRAATPTPAPAPAAAENADGATWNRANAEKLLGSPTESRDINAVRAAVEQAFLAHPEASRLVSQGLMVPRDRVDLDIRICGSRPERGADDSSLLACSTLQGCVRLIRLMYDYYVQKGYEEFYEAATAVYSFVATTLPDEFEAFYKLLRAELRVSGLPAE